MSSLPLEVFKERPVVILDLPLPSKARLLHPDQMVVRFGGGTQDLGAFCYTLRSNKKRKPNSAREVVLASFCEARVNQIRQVISVFSIFLADGGMRPATVFSHMDMFKIFMDWADSSGHHDCLAGGDATRAAYRQFSNFVQDRLNRHEFQSANGVNQQTFVLNVLEAVTGISDLSNGIRFIRQDTRNRNATEPASEHNFAHILALNDSLFKGLSELVLDDRKFPFKLPMPKSLHWDDDYLWVFPTSRWCMPPHLYGEARVQMERPFWCYDYKNGRVATVEEIWSHYKSGSESLKRTNSQKSIENAIAGLAESNGDARSHFRLLLAMVAHNAFYFLFLANTGGNSSPVADIETDGTLDVSTANPGYRTTKWRANGKEVKLIVPVAFVPALHRFMELRRYILDGKAFPNLFFRLGTGRGNPPERIRAGILESSYLLLRRIDPKLVQIRAKKIRATVADYYRRKHDATIEASVLQHKEATAEAHYNAGTEARQHIELTLLMEKMAQKAKQKVVEKGAVINDAKPLEDGGVCSSYGQPESISSDAPVKPNCKTGCLFCGKRVLIAGEEDARKVASAAFLMEQLITGPMSESEFRPQIAKCDEDLERIREFENCADMVDRVKKDVFENGNLTPFFADKYQLFLALGVL